MPKQGRRCVGVEESWRRPRAALVQNSCSGRGGRRLDHETERRPVS